MAFKKNKFNAVRTVVDGLSFDSKAESKHYLWLKEQQRAGLISYIFRQIPFDLPGNVKYKADFMVVYPGGRVEFQDVKGMMTPVSKLKIKQVKDIHGVDVVIIESKRAGKAPVC